MFPKRIFNVLESFILCNRARNESRGLRRAPAQILDTATAVRKHQSRRASRPGASHNMVLHPESTALAGKPVGPLRVKMHCHISSAQKVTLTSKEKSQFSIPIVERRERERHRKGKGSCREQSRAVISASA